MLIPFIGREREIADFRHLVEMSSFYTPRLTLITGSVGVGKTALMKKFKQMSENFANIHTAWLDLALEENVRINSLLEQVNGNQAVNEPNYFYDLPLFAHTHSSYPNRTLESKLEYQYDNVITQINRIASRKKFILFIDADVSHRSNLRIIYDNLIKNLAETVQIVLATRYRNFFIIPSATNYNVINLSCLRPEDVRQLALAIDPRYEDAWKDLDSTSQGIPLVLCDLLDQSLYTSDPKLGRRIPYKGKLFLDRVFAEIQDARIRSTLRYAALCRRFNLELLKRLSRSRQIEHHFATLTELSFVESAAAWWSIEYPVRRFLSQEQRINSPDRFNSNINNLLNYFSKTTFLMSSPYDHLLDKIYYQLYLDEHKAILEARKGDHIFETLGDNQSNSALIVDLEQHIAGGSIVKEYIKFFNITRLLIKHRWQEAIEKFENLLQVSTNPRLQADILYRLALTEFECGHWVNAEQIIRKSIRGFNQIDDQYFSFYAVLLLVRILTCQHKLEEAEQALIAISKSPRDELAEFEISLVTASLLRSKGAWQLAYEKLEKALLHVENPYFLRLRARVWHEFGKLYKVRNDLDNAMYCYKEALRYYQELGEDFIQAQILHSLGILHFKKNDIEKAEKHFHDSLELKTGFADQYGIAKSFNALGHISRVNNNLESAIDHYKRSLTLFKEIGNQTKSTRVLCRLGMTLSSMENRLGEAIEYLEESKMIRLGDNDRQGVSEALYELGLVYEKQHDTQMAQDSFSLSYNFALASNSVTRQLAPLVKLIIGAYREGDSIKGTQLINAVRRITDISKQNRMLTNLYFQSAEAELQNDQYLTAFLCYAEGIYISSIDHNSSIHGLLHTVNQQIEQLDKYGYSLAEDFSRKVILYWQNYCEPQPTSFWTILQYLTSEKQLQRAKTYRDTIKQLVIRTNSS